MTSVFQVVYEFLRWLSARTGLTYPEVNILVYYLLFPLVCLSLVDRIRRTWICSAVFAAAWLLLLLLVPSFERFCAAWFHLSEAFLRQFSRFGWNYTEASVWVCVVFPGLVLLVLLFMAIRRR
jgi:hypothetical protein